LEATVERHEQAVADAAEERAVLVERHAQASADAAEEHATLVSQVASLVLERQDFEQAFARMNQDAAKVSGGGVHGYP